MKCSVEFLYLILGLIYLLDREYVARIEFNFKVTVKVDDYNLMIEMEKLVCH